ncbi:MAG: ROK family protein [Verrucomicrobiales bacterium]|nr:ROK family protein [Verrucomicrobiales bacterium]
MGMILGIDIGGTSIKGGAYDLVSGECLAREECPTRDGEQEQGEPAFLAETRRLIGTLESRANLPALATGISAPGLANREATAIAFMPGRLEGLEDLDWSEALGCPVTVLNDAHAALMGELWQGGAKGCREVILLTLGTGVGGAIVSGGRLLRGHVGKAGHLGHISLDYRGAADICGCPGSLEDQIGNHNVTDRSGGRFPSTHDLIRAVEAGDAGAARIWDDSVRALAAAIASYANILDPERVLIGGGISRGWEILQPRLEAWLDRFEWRPGGARVELRRATLGEWAGSLGAAYYASTEAGLERSRQRE